MRRIILALLIFTNVGISKGEAIDWKKVEATSGICMGTFYFSAFVFFLGYRFCLKDLRDRLNTEPISVRSLEEDIRRMDNGNFHFATVALIGAIILKCSYDNYPSKHICT